MTVPSCTYRIQFNPRFTFNDLYNILDYLADLGITGLYASPLLQPTKGSEHGYDGINVTCINPELGSMDDLYALSAKLKSKCMCWIQDIVPNHLAFNTDNVWLHDVLERGMHASYAHHFDIDWEHPAYPGQLMVPFLETTVEECIEQKKLQFNFIKGKGFCFSYYTNHYPVSPETITAILSADNVLSQPLDTSITGLIQNIAEGYDSWKSMYTKFLQLLSNDTIQQCIGYFNDRPSELLTLIQSQHYVLCPHTESNTHINYRRFFNVNGLICLRVEDENVFHDYHRYVHELYTKNIIQGLRIDHIDGLKNPHEYIRRLRKLFGEDCYIIVEKILDVKEELPASMAIQGTSGYEFLSYINQVITNTKGSEKLLALYQQYVPEYSNYEDIIFKNKLANFEMYLNGEWNNLVHYLLSLNLIDENEMDAANLKMALGIFMACFPVYRVYIETIPPDINDEQLIVHAFVNANKRYPEFTKELGILRQLFEPHSDEQINTNRLLFVQRLMQFTGPLAAKGVEDTTFYQYNPLISHNEVGDQPCVLGIPVRVFHEKMQERLLKNNLSFNCTSTHDTKRGEDNRVRINVLSEVTEEWTQLVAQWQEMNEPFRKQFPDGKAPIVNDEYFLYQAITGGFPENLQVTDQFKERTKKYFIKVLRESKVMSNHVLPNLDYENACLVFIDHLLNPSHDFLQSLIPFVKKIITYANVYSMVQVIIKTSAPGIPDIYQGCELWDLSYVDPDNRRPVDYELRKNLLKELKQLEIYGSTNMHEFAKESYATGTQKLLVTWKMLQLRNANHDLFVTGEYIPLYSEGSDRIIIAYCRHNGEEWVLIILPVGIVEDSRKELQIKLPEGAPQNWKNIFTNEQFNSENLRAKELFKTFPVAVLTPS